MRHNAFDAPFKDDDHPETIENTLLVTKSKSSSPARESFDCFCSLPCLVPDTKGKDKTRVQFLSVFLAKNSWRHLSAIMVFMVL